MIGGIVDLSSEQGANILRRAIESYWVANGRPNIKTSIEPIIGKGGVTFGWSVRSNIFNGCPPKEVVQ